VSRELGGCARKTLLPTSAPGFSGCISVSRLALLLSTPHRREEHRLPRHIRMVFLHIYRVQQTLLVSDVKSIIEMSNASLTEFSYKLQQLQFCDDISRSCPDRRHMLLPPRESVLQTAESGLGHIMHRTVESVEMTDRNAANLDDIQVLLGRISRSVVGDNGYNRQRH